LKPGQAPGGATYTRVLGATGENADRVAYVYLLRCGDGSLYCGWTTDLDRRLAAHAAGRGARYTRSRLPVSLAGAWEVADRRSARSLEARVKALGRPAKERLLAGEALSGAVRIGGS